LESNYCFVMLNTGGRLYMHRKLMSNAEWCNWTRRKRRHAAAGSWAAAGMQSEPHQLLLLLLQDTAQSMTSSWRRSSQWKQCQHGSGRGQRTASRQKPSRVYGNTAGVQRQKEIINTRLPN